ncbi:PLP-dependent aminotransferase family protein [Aquabacterium sp.]|jgi:DNA-binding transcriptional MocR family regulator|uniref:aminotransferase-like domain-containing protein n=1 Tax=Aquabacterium sp. TaxID=1872578 RepID=UPI0027B8C419|nr:PLP-dependent aminotransferase family protein [Aquabacterium sp.]
MSTLYEQLAESLEQRIRDGHLRPGERLPSVRQACAQAQVSAATVFQAYYLLESRGLIEARPRSGYYVCRPVQGQARPALPEQVRTESTPVAISELVFEVLNSTRDREVVPLGSAFPAPELFPLDRLARAGARAMRHLAPQALTAELTAGNARLRDALRARYIRQGIVVNPDDPIITNGAMEALNLCLQAVTQPGDVVAVESPTFYAALQALERLHLRAIEIPTDPTSGIDPDGLAEVLSQHRVAACWLMPSFQNPLGALMPTSRRQAIVQTLAQAGVPVVEDDVYGELYHGATRPLPLKAFDREGLVLHCSSFSKCLAPGYRVGWAAAGRFAPAVQRLKMMSSLATSVPSQMALAEYLEEGGFDRHLRRLRLSLANNLAKVRLMVLKYFPPGTRVSQPQGGYFLWIQLPEHVDTLKLHRAALSQGISIAPGLLFSADMRFRNSLRLNGGHPNEPNMVDAIRTLGVLASQGPGRTA